ncbi:MULTISPECIES: tetratricopeptide repeat protein [unclassified Paludibacterium]|uniref:tetratricopeptide repeat protein n=1 Tax=unclassified Paludibacterium TaxID=2618429 RepID=UPI001C03A896|nr:tetratricopeptide repeat protein [Paludibacterium sp. B53371]BEV72230.1 tetratricopeptide repeat protein [Paludibacterium sp. THUN1379]
MVNPLPGELLQLKKEAGRQRQNPVLWQKLAQRCVELALPAEAHDAFLHLTRLQPDNGAAWFGLANQAYLLGQYPQALDGFMKALSINPASAEIRNNLALLLAGLGELSLAEQLWLEALDSRPDYQDALNNLGNLYRDCRQFEQAHLCLETALQLAPDSARVMTNLGLLLKAEGRLDEALTIYRQALDQAGDPPPELPYNYSIALIQSGEWLRGFRWYEQRWALPRLAARKQDMDAQLPAWQGEYLAGKTLLLWQEQGLGDTLQMVRLLPLWRARQPECRVVLRVAPPLLRLLAGLPGVDLLLDTQAPLPPADFHLSLMSLPMQLQLTPDTLPPFAPYLAADPALTARWAPSLPARRGRPRLGLVWQSGQAGTGADERDRQARSLSHEVLHALLSSLDADWVSLQFGAEALPDELQAMLAQPALTDFADSAAILGQLDGLVTVDTAAAHLGAAMGLPTVVLMSALGGNLFPAEGERMPWYPSMRLLRQQTLHDWQNVLQVLPEVLSTLLEPQ